MKDDDDFDPWCKDFEKHVAAHKFCDDHQAMWCLICDRGCVSCAHDPHCPHCHCGIDEHHRWDCPYQTADPGETP